MDDSQRDRVLRAHDEFLNQAIDFIKGVPIEVDGKPGRVIVFALVARVIQIGCALQEMLERGYGREAFPLARSMLSGMLNVVAIVDDDTDGRALQFILFAERYHNALVDRAEKYEIFAPEQATEARRRTHEQYASMRRTFAKAGVEPASLGGSSRTWHGLNTERDLFDKMGMLHIYELDYAWLSDATHVGIDAVTNDVKEAFEEGTGFGPKGELPREVISASGIAISEVLAQFSNLQLLNKRDQAKAMRDALQAVLRAEFGANGLD